MPRLPDKPERRALYEPMLWLVIALPAASVVAGIATLLIALRAGGADAISTQVQRTAQIQVEDLAPDRRADALELTATLQLDRGTGAVGTILTQPGVVADLQLRLLLQHPAEARADHATMLVRSGERWLGRLEPVPAAHAWNLQLVSGDGRWRLWGRLEAGASSATLRPRLEH